MIVCTRSAAIRKGGAAGRRAGVVARATGSRMTRDRARKLAGELDVPERWRPLFTKHFVRAALRVEPYVEPPPSKYGVA